MTPIVCRPVNPVTEFRVGLGLNKKEFCLRYGVKYVTLNWTENGLSSAIPAPVMQVLEQNGINRDAAAIQFEAWKNSFRKAA